MSNVFSYEGKRVAIVGCFSGMGMACAQQLVNLGAEVHGADIKPSPVSLASFTPVDLSDWASIDRVVASIGGKIDALFNCAGLPQTFPAASVLSVNFLGIRHWTEQWLPRIKRGGAVVSISSLAGMGYLTNMENIRSALAISDRERFLQWVEGHVEIVGDGYGFSKELLNAWTCAQAVEQASKAIRFNATMPGPTETPMIAAFEDIAGQAVLDAFTVPSGRRSTAEEQGNALVLLNSDAARFVSGVCLPVDGGFFGGVSTGLIDMQALLSDTAATA
jgi:NAD(P)-dependent dehydrogenase (short-subunit alcohol dehydrogenase family)